MCSMYASLSRCMRMYDVMILTVFIFVALSQAHTHTSANGGHIHVYTYLRHVSFFITTDYGASSDFLTCFILV